MKPTPDSEPSAGPAPSSPQATGRWVPWVSVLLSAAIVIWFYGIVPRFGVGREHSAFSWIFSYWDDDYDSAHGVLFPFVVGGLIIYRLKDLKAAVKSGSAWGLLPMFLGVCFYIFGYRNIDPRSAIYGLPLILWGSAWFLWGWRVAMVLTFPLFYFLLALPLPSLQQATTNGNLLTASLAQHGCSFFGIQIYLEGTRLIPIKDSLPIIELQRGLAGLPSLMVLLMISGAWAYMANIAIWKKVLLFLSAFPLAILGNALKVISVFVIAEYGDEKWARTTWHDWSKPLLFYPFCLMLLLLIHSVLQGRLPWKKPTSASSTTL